jgi:peptidoglycan hydrolase CwlO-like protein
METNSKNKRAGKSIIGTSIPDEILAEIKKKGLHYNELIIKGLQATAGMPALLDRANNAEERVSKIVAKLEEVARELYETQEKLKASDERIKALEAMTK